MTIVYRARCFESQKSFEEFNKRNPAAASIKPKKEEIDTSKNLQLEDILKVLRDDLI